MRSGPFAAMRVGSTTLQIHESDPGREKNVSGTVNNSANRSPFFFIVVERCQMFAGAHIELGADSFRTHHL